MARQSTSEAGSLGSQFFSFFWGKLLRESRSSIDGDRDRSRVRGTVGNGGLNSCSGGRSRGEATVGSSRLLVLKLLIILFGSILTFVESDDPIFEFFEVGRDNFGGESVDDIREVLLESIFKLVLQGFVVVIQKAGDRILFAWKKSARLGFRF
jgi:hypothetical protein